MKQPSVESVYQPNPLHESKSGKMKISNLIKNGKIVTLNQAFGLDLDLLKGISNDSYSSAELDEDLLKNNLPANFKLDFESSLSGEESLNDSPIKVTLKEGFQGLNFAKQNSFSLDKPTSTLSSQPKLKKGASSNVGKTKLLPKPIKEFIPSNVEAPKTQQAAQIHLAGQKFMNF